jgi:hypothetical protein
MFAQLGKTLRAPRLFAANPVDRRRTVRDFPSCAGIASDLACFRVCIVLSAVASYSEQRLSRLGACP